MRARVFLIFFFVVFTYEVSCKAKIFNELYIAGKLPVSVGYSLGLDVSYKLIINRLSLAGVFPAGYPQTPAKVKRCSGVVSLLFLLALSPGGGGGKASFLKSLQIIS